MQFMFHNGEVVNADQCSVLPDPVSIKCRKNAINCAAGLGSGLLELLTWKCGLEPPIVTVIMVYNNQSMTGKARLVTNHDSPTHTHIHIPEYLKLEYWGVFWRVECEPSANRAPVLVVTMPADRGNVSTDGPSLSQHVSADVVCASGDFDLWIKLNSRIHNDGVDQKRGITLD